MPSIYVCWGDCEYTCASVVSVATMSGKGGLNHIALPLS